MFDETIKIATIEYKPVCSECGAIIEDEVACVYEKELLNDERIYKLKHIRGQHVEPVRCKKCGAIFDQICLPLPDSLIRYE